MCTPNPGREVLRHAALASLMVALLGSNVAEARPRCASAKACFALGEKLSRSSRSPEAYAALTRACKLGLADGCVGAANMRWRGVGFHPRPKPLTRLLRRACRLDQRHCARRDALLRYLRRVGRCNRDCAAAPYPTAHESTRWDFLFHHARCQRRAAASCHWLAERYRDAYPRKARLGRAAKLFARACKLGSKASCAARWELRDHQRCSSPADCRAKIEAFKKTWRSKRRAVLLALRAHACLRRGDADACFYAAIATRSWRPRAALSYLQKGCKLGHGSSCASFAETSAERSGGKRTRRAAAAAARACQLDGYHCDLLIALSNKYTAWRRPLAELRSYRRRACTAKNRVSCHPAGQKLFVATTKIPPATLAKQAPKLVRELCQARIGAACLALKPPCRDKADCLALGARLKRGTWQHRGAALHVYRRACALRSGEGCYEAGLLAHKDAAAAKALFYRGCDNYHQGACLRHALLQPLRSLARRRELSQVCGQGYRGFKAVRARACKLFVAEGRYYKRRTSARRPRPAPAKPKLPPRIRQLRHAKLVKQKRSIEKRIKKLRRMMRQVKPTYRRYNPRAKCKVRRSGRRSWLGCDTRCYPGTPCKTGRVSGNPTRYGDLQEYLNKALREHEAVRKKLAELR